MLHALPHLVNQFIAKVSAQVLTEIGFQKPLRWRSPLIGFLVAVMCWMGMPQAIALAQDDLSTPGSSIQPYIDRVMDRVTEFTLENGMKFIVLERHQAPVISFMTYVDVGSAEEAPGKTGAAHFLEHLAFKGTQRIGTTNYAAEAPLLEQMDVLYEQLRAAEAAGDTETAAQLTEEFQAVRAEAASYVEQNEYGQIVEQYGGVGLNATTSADATRYFYSFPSNKLELWMSLESERFLEPVFREFYEEQDVILEERRMRTDNSPIGKMIEEFLQTALPDYPYGRPIIGYAEDIRNLTRQDIQEFFETYYTPSHMIMAIVGDVDPDEAKRLAETYFGRFNPAEEAPELEVTPPTQTATREIVLELPSQPWYLEGYQRPGISDPDNAIYDIIATLLTGGRTARLYQALVEQQQLALNVNVSTAFPGDRFPNILLLYALTAPGHTVEEVAAAIEMELTKLQTEPVPPAELDRVKTQARAGLLRTLSSNQGMASLLPEYEAKTGDWRNLFEQLKVIDAVTPEEVQQVAQQLFRPENKTIGKLLSAE